MTVISFTRFASPPSPAMVPAATSPGAQATPDGTGAGSILITPCNQMANFNVSSLPSCVLTRHNLNQAANSVMIAAEMGPFRDTSGPTPRKFLRHQENPQAFITRSGNMFIFPSTSTGYDKNTPDRFKKTAPKRNAWVLKCIRWWHVNFVYHVTQHYVYFHALYYMTLAL